MRLLVARCEVRYIGRLNALLPEALRLIIVKADGSVLIHADAGGYKPLNWMTPPTVIEESADKILVRKRGQADGDRLEIDIAEILSDVSHDMGSPDADTALTKDGVEAHLQELLSDAAGVVRGGLPARAPRVADRHRAGRSDVPRRGRTSGWRSRSSGSPGSRRSSSSRATSSESGSTRRSRSCRGVLAAQTIKPQARVLARRPRDRCVEVDLAVLRGEREPELRLFAA